MGSPAPRGDTTRTRPSPLVLATAASTGSSGSVARGAGRVRRLWDRRLWDGRLWDGRAVAWQHHGAAGLGRVLDAMVATAGPVDRLSVVDLGCGNGQLSLPLARAGAYVVGVDISAKMIETLERDAAAEGLWIRTALCPIQELRIAPGTVDLVVSSYAMHHLYDEEKRSVLCEAVTWLRPGGRVVVGDMMFGRGATRQDREIIASKLRVMLSRGPSGWWRIVKNVARFTLRVRERPLSMETWMRMCADVGLVDVHGARVVAEAAIVTGKRPEG